MNHGIRAYKSGICRCEICCAANTRSHKLWLLGRSPRLIDPTGTKRRIEGLLALGWTYRDIGEHAGRSRGWAHEIHRTPGRVRQDIAALISAAYDALSMTIPEGRYVNRNRNYAQSHGYLPPLAWDDATIDDPATRPHGQTTTEGRIRERDFIDPVVVERLLAGERMWCSPAEKRAALGRWVASGGSRAELCKRLGWKEGRYNEQEAS